MSKTRKLYRCKRCQYATTSKSNYTRHKQSQRHKGNKKEVKKYKCKNCKYETTDSSNWRRHCKSKRHLNGGKEPETCKCELCDKTFATPRVCKVHMYRHYDKKQLLNDIARMKGKLSRVKKCTRRKWLSEAERNAEVEEAESQRVNAKLTRIANYERRLKKMVELYKNNTLTVPNKFTDADIDIMAEERNQIMDRLAEIEDDTEDRDALYHNAEYARLEEREAWLTNLILKHRYCS